MTTTAPVSPIRNVHATADEPTTEDLKKLLIFASKALASLALVATAVGCWRWSAGDEVNPNILGTVIVATSLAIGLLSATR